jgi:hypothetical protein
VEGRGTKTSSRHSLEGGVVYEIESAPEFDEERYREQSYRNELGSYYGGRAHARSGDGI